MVSLSDDLYGVGNAPAPVVPPARLEDSTAGDWWTVYSRPPTATSTDEALGSTKPRFCEAMGRE